jgi:tetratricopeptide (TPR) repeat protein
VAALGQPHALALAVRIREQAAEQLAGCSEASSVAAGAEIDRLLERGELLAAYSAAQRLLTQVLGAGDTGYPGADFYIATTYLRLGRVLQLSGDAEAALTPLTEAQTRLHRMSEVGDKSAGLMLSLTYTEIGDCLAELGRLNEAAAAYEEQIRRAPALGDSRGAAVAKGQLAYVRLRQKRYAESLESYNEARSTFQGLGEQRMVAVSWHQIGMAHQAAGQFEFAENAYREALAIKVRDNDLAGQSSTLHQLGNLSDAMGRAEEAVALYRQAAHIAARSEDLAGEGRTRSNLAETLLGLGRYDEARIELQRAVECKAPYGHTVEPWKSWALLERLERATGQTEEADVARVRAIDAYLAYRRDGGISQNNNIELFSLVAAAIRGNTQIQPAQQLHRLLEPDHPLWVTTLIRQLQAILAGIRDLGLAADPALGYRDAAELTLLLESLGEADPADQP